MGILDNSKKRMQRFQITTRVCMSMVLVAVSGVCGSVHAFEINTGNEDLVIHWDNTLRYTLTQRVRGQSQDIVNSVNNNAGDQNFNVGLVSSRLDLLSETDVVYKKDYGVRLSGAGWYDPIVRNELNNVGAGTYVKDRFGGVDAELLDAFAFGKIDVGSVPVSVRAGRHTIYWGEAFFPAAGANSINYAQSPIDMAKALAMPGVELKEIFRPLNQVSATIQPTQEITLAAQYYLQWESNIFPEGGTYLGMVNGFLNSNQAFLLPFGPLPNSGNRYPRQAGDWGIKVAYSPEALNTTLGFYYRNFSDKLPQVLTPNGLAPGTYYYDYKSGINLYGISFAKNILGVSVGAELSYRENMPLTTEWFAPAGARGNTEHALVNFLTLLPKTPVFDTGSAILEFAYGRWDRVTANAQYFTGMHNPNYTGGYTNDGLDHATRDNATVTINFVPEWKQVLNGVDLSMPLNFSMGMFGNAATLTGGAAGSGTYSGGLSFDVYNKYKIDLTYASFFGYVHPAGGQVLPPGLAAPGQGAEDPIALLRDRDLLSLTLKTTF